MVEATSYERRTPTATVLHAVVREHPESFLAEARRRSGHGYGVPRHIERELRNYLTCGVLAHGFVRVRCVDCGFDRLVAFACKGRAVCPSCRGRRMADAGAHLVDRVLLAPVAFFRRLAALIPPPRQNQPGITECSPPTQDFAPASLRSCPAPRARPLPRRTRIVNPMPTARPHGRRRACPGPSSYAACSATTFWSARAAPAPCRSWPPSPIPTSWSPSSPTSAPRPSRPRSPPPARRPRSPSGPALSTRPPTSTPTTRVGGRSSTPFLRARARGRSPARPRPRWRSRDRPHLPFPTCPRRPIAAIRSPPCRPRTTRPRSCVLCSQHLLSAQPARADPAPVAQRRRVAAWLLVAGQPARAAQPARACGLARPRSADLARAPAAAGRAAESAVRVVVAVARALCADPAPRRAADRTARAAGAVSAPAVPTVDDERARIVAALDACAGNQTRAAVMLGISRRTLVYRLSLYGLARPRKA